MEKSELEIIDQSMQLFLKAGIKGVTMDDLSRNLGISKKTLYKFVTDKNDLVEKSLMYSCDQDNAEIGKICDKHLNAIDESYEISLYIFRHINTLHPSIVYDLQKYHPMAWDKFKNLKSEKIHQCYMDNISRGIDEGLYRDNLSIPVIVNYYTSKFDLMFDTYLFPPDRYNPADVYLEIFRYHIRGIASEKGIKYLVKKMQSEKIKQS